MSTNSKTGASCAVTGNVSCSKKLSKDTSTSGLEKMSRLEWVAGLGILCAAAAVVVIVLRICLTVKACFEKCQSYYVFDSFLLLLLLFFCAPFLMCNCFWSWNSFRLTVVFSFSLHQYPIVSLLFSRLHASQLF